jgi:putative membrane protein
MFERRRSFVTWVWPPPPIAWRLWIALAGSAVYSALVWAIHPYFISGKQVWADELAVVNTAVLGLLVSFRTKIAYDRWWEGRVLWGQLVNNSRNLCLKARDLVNLDAAERIAFAGLVSAFAVAFQKHLRGPVQLSEVPGFEKDTATPAHVPAYIAGKVIATVAAWRTAGRIDGYTHLMFDTHTSAFMDICGACERVRNTPLPASYLSLLRHAMLLGFAFTPWALVDAIGPLVVPVQAAAVYFMFGIELTAEAVEQPFGSDGDDLPLEAFCETIRKSAEDILGTP